jgi:hypothetical protein
MTLYDQMGGEKKLRLFIDYFLEALQASPGIACYS